MLLRDIEICSQWTIVKMVPELYNNRNKKQQFCMFFVMSLLYRLFLTASERELAANLTFSEHPKNHTLDSQLPLQQFSSGYWTLAPDSCDPKGPEENHHNIILRWLRILLQSRVMLQPSSKSATMATMASAADSDPRDPTGWAWLAVPHGDSDGSQRQSWNKEWDFRKPMKITGNSMNINEPYIIYIYCTNIYVHIIIYIYVLYIYYNTNTTVIIIDIHFLPATTWTCVCTPKHSAAMRCLFRFFWSLLQHFHPNTNCCAQDFPTPVSKKRFVQVLRTGGDWWKRLGCGGCRDHCCWPEGLAAQFQFGLAQLKNLNTNVPTCADMQPFLRIVCQWDFFKIIQLFKVDGGSSHQGLRSRYCSFPRHQPLGKQQWKSNLQGWYRDVLNLQESI